MGGMRALSLIKIPVTGGGSSISLTTIGTSGVATLIGGVLNIPNYNSTPTTPAGSDNDIQINEGGAFAADSGVFTYNPTGRVFSTQDFTASATSLFYTDGTDQFGVSGGALAYVNAAGNVFGITNTGQVNVANNIVVGNNTDTITSGFVTPTLISISGTYNISGGLLNFGGVIISPTINYTGGTAVINGFAFRPTVTGVPQSLNAFTNTVGNCAFNTLGGVTAIGPANPINTTSILQVYGTGLMTGKLALGGIQITPPTAQLQFVTPGTAAAGDGQLKLIIDSALKTTPENGLFEYFGGILYFTLGSIRKPFSFGSSLSRSVSTKTSNYTITSSDSIILVDATAGNIVISAPAPSGVSGLEFAIKKIDSSANTVTITPLSGTIDGGANAVITTQNASISFVSNSTNYYIL